VGDDVQFTAFNVIYDQAIKHWGLEEITPSCWGPYFVVGEEFAAVKTP